MLVRPKRAMTIQKIVETQDLMVKYVGLKPVDGYKDFINGLPT